MIHLDNILDKIIEDIDSIGGVSFFVGGYVRDQLLGTDNKDIDIEVFGIESDKLHELLKTIGKVDAVGKSFGVFKMGDLDISLPRREKKEGKGHKGFQVTTDPYMTVKEAASRRDFTINAIYKNTITNELIDPFNGILDLENKILRPTSERFKEDPLRVLRGIQFISRFDLTPTRDFNNYSQELLSEFDTLPKERIWVEFEKLAAKGKNIYKALAALETTMWIKKFTEIFRLIIVEQDPIYHPEGSVWRHSMHVAQQAANICDREGVDRETRVICVLAAICHDMGKVKTTIFKDGRIRSPKHAQAGVDISRDFLRSIKAPNKIINEVGELTLFHMYHTHDIDKKTVRRLLTKLKYTDIKKLCILMEADVSGRPPLPKGKTESIIRVEKFALELESEPQQIKPMITGNMIIEQGITDGREIGRIKKELFDIQITHGHNFETMKGQLLHLISEKNK